MQQVIDFILELDKLKGVTRKTRPLGLDRYENSAEHSWQIAMLAASLAHYAHTPIDVNRVIFMLLVHDIGEIDTGDTIFYAEEGLADRKAAEKAAVTRIFGMLPDSHGDKFMELWLEFEEATSAEARFAHAVDRAMPALLNLANNGQSWRENGVRHEQVVRKLSGPIKTGCPALWEYLETKLEEAKHKQLFGSG